ncbi:MAG: hypothetical protein Q9181_007233, partial [Wetmoreana brouardii]
REEFAETEGEGGGGMREEVKKALVGAKKEVVVGKGGAGEASVEQDEMEAERAKAAELIRKATAGEEL